MKKLTLYALLFALTPIAYAISPGSISDAITNTAPSIIKHSMQSTENPKTPIKKEITHSTENSTHIPIGNPFTFVEDAAITGYIHTQLLLTKNIPSHEITVSTEKGIVTLIGTVATDAQANTIIKVASAVKGVKSVNVENLYITNDEAADSEEVV